MSNQNGSNGSAPAELARVLTLRSLVYHSARILYNIRNRNQHDSWTCIHDICSSNSVHGIHSI